MRKEHPMIGTPLAQKVLRAEYKVLRVPLRALDRGLGRRLPEGSRLRHAIERGLAGADVAAGRLLNDDGLLRRGTVLHEHAETAQQAVRQAERAAELRAAAEQTEERARAEAAQKRADARRAERDRVARARRREQQAEREAAEQGRAEAARKKREVRKRANARSAQARQSRSVKDQRIAETTRRATAPAKATLKDAAKEKSAAATRRAQAGKLARLAETEKKTRQAARSQSS
jgi:hypothetical protein